MLKKFIWFVLLLLPWFLSSFLINDISYFDEINKPFFTLPGFLYPFVWIILYCLIVLSIIRIIRVHQLKDIKPYLKVLLINYVFNQLYQFFFFKLNNLFLSFVDTVIIFITSLFLYYETKPLDEKASKYLLPYVFFSFYALILSMVIYFMNF